MFLFFHPTTERPVINNSCLNNPVSGTAHWITMLSPFQHSWYSWEASLEAKRALFFKYSEKHRPCLFIFDCISGMFYTIDYLYISIIASCTICANDHMFVCLSFKSPNEVYSGEKCIIRGFCSSVEGFKDRTGHFLLTFAHILTEMHTMGLSASVTIKMKRLVYMHLNIQFCLSPILIW